MMIVDLPDKSATAKSATASSDKPKLEPVTKAEKVQRPATRRFMDRLFAESPKALGGRVLRDVIEPRIKAGVEEALNSFISGMMWGDSANRPISSMRGTVLRGGNVSYSAMSSPSALSQARAAVPRRAMGNYHDIALPTQQDAELVLANMYEVLNEYRRVAVADLYELVGLSSETSDNGYGWTSLDGARINKTRAGYSLELPRPSLL